MLVSVVALVHEFNRKNSREVEKTSFETLSWTQWHPGIVELHQKRGKAVWLHFHANYDISGIINRRRLLGNPDVVADLYSQEVVMVEANWGWGHPDVQKELKRMGGWTVPYDLVIPADSSKPLIRLPPILEADDFRKALRLARID